MGSVSSAEQFELYLLKLENNKWYVGKSKNVKARFQEHLEQKGAGAEWTRLHRPMIVAQRKPCQDDKFAEDSFVLACMEKYGIENVRGGSWSHPTLSRFETQYIQKLLASANDACYSCHKSGHLAKNCPTRQPVSDEKALVALGAELAQEDRRNCESKTLVPPRNGVFAHFAVGHKRRYEQDNSEESEDAGDTCFRCGRNSHYVKDCFARTDVHGKPLVKRQRY